MLSASGTIMSSNISALERFLFLGWTVSVSASRSGCFQCLHFIRMLRERRFLLNCLYFTPSSISRTPAFLAAALPRYSPSGKGMCTGRHTRDLSAVNEKIFYESLTFVDGSKFLPV